MKKKGKLLILAMGTLSAWYGVAFVRSLMPRINKRAIAVSVDPLFSTGYQQKIASLVHGYERITLPNASLLQLLKEALPLVKQISLVDDSADYIQKNKFNIKFIAYKPVVKVNTQELLLENGMLIQASYFNPKLINSLYQVEVKKDDQVLNAFSKKYVEFKNYLALDVFDHYKVNWQDEYSIIINKKDTPLITYVGSFETHFDETLLKACDLVKEKLALVNSLEKNKKNNEWFLDVRFKNQVVAFNKKGGIHEKSIY